MIGLSHYDLADAELIQTCKERAKQLAEFEKDEHIYMQYVPERTMVVIGAGNKLESSVNIKNCIQDRISIIQRPSGGEAVLISPSTLLFTHIMLAEVLPSSKEFFELNLDVFTIELRELGVKDLNYRGISDLCIGDRKILGCAIYRTKRMAIFQAVLNISESPAKIAKYLLAPQRMPEYRLNRAHEEFVTSLSKEGYQISPAEIDLAARFSSS